MVHHDKKEPTPLHISDWIATAGSVASIAGFIAIAPNHPVITGLAVVTFAALIWAKMDR